LKIIVFVRDEKCRQYVPLCVVECFLLYIFPLEDDLHGPFGPHHCYLSRWEGIIKISLEMLLKLRMGRGI
jgi:hypothetical protein